MNLYGKLLLSSKGSRNECLSCRSSIVVTPALVMVSAAGGGVTSLIPNFDARFAVAMLHLRDELVVVDETKNSVELAADYQKRLPEVLVAGFKKPV